MSKRTKLLCLAVAVAFIAVSAIGLAAGKGGAVKANAAAAGSDAYVRLDSLGAEGSEGRAKVVSQVGAEVGAYVGINGEPAAPQVGAMEEGKAIVLGDGDSITLEFDLPDDTTEGKLHLMGNKSLMTATVGIYIPGYGENDGYYVIGGGSFCEGGLTAVEYAYSGSCFIDEGRKIISVRIWGGTDASPVVLVAASAAPDLYRVGDAVDLGPLSQGMLEHFFYFGGGDERDIYWDNLGMPNARPSLRVRTTNLEFHIPKDKTKLTFGWEVIGVNTIFVGIKPAEGSPDGTPADFTAVANGVAADISAYPVVNDDYRRVLVLLHAEGDCFLTAMNMTAAGDDKDREYESLASVNENVPADETYSYFTAGSEEERAHLFVPAEGVEGDFNETDAALVADAYLDYSDAAANARRLQAGSCVIYEFDLGDEIGSAVLKIDIRGRYAVSAHTDESVKRYRLSPSSTLGGGLGATVWQLTGEDALSSEDNKFRICIEAESETFVHALLVGAADGGQSAADLAEGLLVTPENENGLKYLTDSVSPDRYYLNKSDPTWFLGGGSSVTYAFGTGDADSVNIIMTVAGVCEWKISYDGNEFEPAGSFGNATGGIPATHAKTIDVAGKETLYIRIEGSSQCFVHSFAVGIAAKADTNVKFDTFTGEEARYVYRVAEDDSASSYGAVGLAAKEIGGDGGRRVAYSAGGSGFVVYRFTYDVSGLTLKDGKNPLFVAAKIPYGQYGIYVSASAEFHEEGTAALIGDAQSDPAPVLDATDILTAASEADGTKTVYVKITTAATVSDGAYPQQECVFTGLGVFADGSNGNKWPNDDDFDYDDPPEYDPNPGLPDLPEDPGTQSGTENLGDGGCAGCNASGAAESLFVSLAILAIYPVVRRRIKE